MQITRNASETAKGPAGWFTGDLYIDAVATPAPPARAAAADDPARRPRLLRAR
jgi:hypothetical protein